KQCFVCYLIQFVKTDKFPVKLHYVEHLDEVWVLCWNSDRNTGSKTIVVIRDASKDSRNHMVHTQPIGNHFDLVQDMFLPPQNDLGHDFHYGYVIHNEQRGLFKLDLDTMRYTKAVDLSTFDCVPQKVAFIPIGGHVVVKCIKKMMDDTRTLQILMDYVTDAPLANITMFGTPYVSPDSRTIVTVDEVTGKVRVATIQEDGQIKKGIDVSVASSISDVTFFPSQVSTGYDLYLTSQDHAVVFHVNLVNGKVTTIKDAEDPRTVRVWPWSQATRSISHGNVFSNYLATPSKSSLVIVNGRDMHVHCKFADLDSPDSVLFSTSNLG
ncbi:follistatin-related protein 5-like, partial [Mizuhopecten yessoensis]|uniref:follistatin-related protein 5-like n=1 Tax=Mizuhopecten yessoensis TaxID=6573 RepID=UPI000B45CFBE